MRLALSVTKKQKLFIDATESEVLFGGAAGGGKSYGQVVDALLFALKYPGSKQLILRRTFAELDKSLIRTALAVYPREIFTLNASSHVGRFKNGSILDDVEALGEGSLTASIPTGIAEEHTLADLFSDVKNGNLASYLTVGEESLYSIINRLLLAVFGEGVK